MHSVHGLILSAAIAAAAPALAETSLGALYNQPVTTSGSWSGSGTQTDIYSFTLTSPGMVAGVVTQTAQIDAFTALLTGPNSVNQLFNLGTSSSLDFGALDAGAYTLTLSGMAAHTNRKTGELTGGYSLMLHSNVAPAAVPGPAGWLVAAAGAAMVTYRVRKMRRPLAA